MPPLRRSTRTNSIPLPNASNLAIAKEHANRGKYEQAQVYATNAIAHDPNSPEGYLLSGQIYLQQGNHDRAVAVYKHGQRVLKNDKEKAILYRCQQAAAMQHDFVRRLPTEVATMIFENIVLCTKCRNPQKQLVECTMVSKLWRLFITTQCPALWRVACWSKYEANASFIMLDTVGHQIDTLLLKGHLPPALSRSVTTHWKQLSFVRSLTCDPCNLMKLVSKLGKQLTSLRIRPEQDLHDHAVHLDKVLSQCPNLRQLILHHGVRIKRHTHQSTTHDSLRTCIVVNDHEWFNDYFDASLVEQVIRRAPNLRTFGINDIATSLSNTFTLLDQHCPFLKRLVFYGRWAHIPFAYKDDDEPTTGLKEIIFSVNASQEYDSFFHPFITQNRDSLEKLVLNIYRYPNYSYAKDTLTETLRRWEHSLGSGTFGKLKTIEYHGPVAAQFSKEALTKLVSNAPVLEEIAMVDLEVDDDRLGAALSRCDHLRTLDMTYGRIASSFCRRFDPPSSLRRVHLCDMKGRVDDFIVALTRVTTLQDVSITSCNVRRAVIQEFVKTFCSHSDPSNLSLVKLPSFKDWEIEALLKHRGHCELLEYEELLEPQHLA